MTMAPLIHADDDSWVRSIRDANLGSLVFITAEAWRQNGLKDTFTGTGFIVDPAGYVLTCNHVIPSEKLGYNKIVSAGSVSGRYEQAYPLTVVRRDEQGDVMLLKLPQKTWQSVKLIAKAQLDSDVVALGFPLDKDVVDAPGLITGVDSDGRWLTNANLNRGMSGGPEFDRSGAVVGIVAGGYEEAKALDLLIPISFSIGLLQFVSSHLTAVPTASPTLLANPSATVLPPSSSTKLAKSPPSTDSFVAVLNLRASSYTADLDRVIQTIRPSDDKDSDAKKEIQQLEELKKRFERLHAEYVAAVRNRNIEVAHELLGQIHLLQKDVITLVESRCGDIALRWYNNLGRVYWAAPPEGQDRIYDKYRQEVDFLRKKTVTLLEKDTYPESISSGSPSIREP